MCDYQEGVTQTPNRIREVIMKVKWILIIVAVLIVLGMYWTRYQVVELSGVGGFYKISRLTGQTELIVGVLTQPVKGIFASQMDIQRQRELREQQGAAQGQQNTPGAPAKKP
jgi:hypothetical protein